MHQGHSMIKTFVGLAIVVAMIGSATRVAQAQTYKSLYSFSGSDGATPQGDLLLDSAGNLYGTTRAGGASDQGTIFKVDSNRHLTTLHNFDYTNGATPAAGLFLDSAGVLHGTTSEGGSNACLPGGCGVIFSIDAVGVYTVEYFFTGADGATPMSTLVSDASGNLYGTTRFGGTVGRGTVFKLDTQGTLTTLYNFLGGEDGMSPFAGLVGDGAGTFYGTTEAGGGPFNYGTVFAVDSSGNESIVFPFTTRPEGNNPLAGLIRDDAGNLYGTTGSGGTNGGVVFKVDSKGNETVLHAFRSADGRFPFAKVIRDSAGNLYGTTHQGGALGYGAVFRLEPSGKLRVLHSFLGGRDQGAPLSGLVRDSAGNLYGTTSRGGVNQSGTIFRISF